jgi:hypothetical protein
VTRPLSHCDGCTGHDPAFLGTEVPLPTLTAVPAVAGCTSCSTAW